MEKKSLLINTAIVSIFLILLLLCANKFLVKEKDSVHRKKIVQITNSIASIFNPSKAKEDTVRALVDNFEETYYAIYYENNLYKVDDNFPQKIYSDSSFVYELTKTYVQDFNTIHEYFVKDGKYFYQTKKDGQYIVEAILYISNKDLYNSSFLKKGFLLILILIALSFFLFFIVTKFKKHTFRVLLDTLPHGIVFINNEKKVELINDFACKLFDFSSNHAISKKYYYIIRNIEIQNKIELVLKKRESVKHSIQFNEGFYTMSIEALSMGLILNITDITREKNAERAQREFFANASHELKSPLTSILGFQEMISCKIIESPEDIKDATEKTIIEANRMNKIIIDMLELSKLEEKVYKEESSVSITTILKEVLESLKAQADKKNISIECLFDENSLITMTKEYGFELFKNILQNAITYNVYGGKIILTQTHEQITIKDTGIGIPKKAQSKVFERFYRVDKTKSREVGGTGLGLAIVKHICNLYGFEITLHSKVNEGTSFIVNF